MASSSSEPLQSNEPEPLEKEEPPAKKRKFECVTNPEEMGLEEYKDWILDPTEDSQQLIPPDTYEPAEPEEPESN